MCTRHDSFQSLFLLLLLLLSAVPSPTNLQLFTLKKYSLAVTVRNPTVVGMQRSTWWTHCNHIKCYFSHIWCSEWDKLVILQWENQHTSVVLRIVKFQPLLYKQKPHEKFDKCLKGFILYWAINAQTIKKNKYLVLGVMLKTWINQALIFTNI